MERAVKDPNFYAEQFKIFKSDAKSTLTHLCRVAIADGSLKSNEQMVLGYFAKRLEMDPESFESILESARKMTVDS